MTRFLSYEQLFADPSSEDAPIITAQVDDELVHSFSYVAAGTAYGIDQLVRALEPLESVESAFDWFDRDQNPLLDEEQKIRQRNKLLKVPKWVIDENPDPDESTAHAEAYIGFEGRFGAGVFEQRNEWSVTRMLFEALALRANVQLCQLPRLGVWSYVFALEDSEWKPVSFFRERLAVAELHVAPGSKLLYD